MSYNQPVRDGPWADTPSEAKDVDWALRGTASDQGSTGKDLHSTEVAPVNELPVNGSEDDADDRYLAQLDPKAARKAKYSAFFTVLASGCALISDGYQNNAMTMTNPLMTKRYGKEVYNSTVSTRVSNALLVGAILGQLVVGLVTDRIGRKAAIVLTTFILVIGAIFATAASPIHGNPDNLFWWLIVARGAVGFGVGGEYPASSVSASEAADERFKSSKDRDTIFIFVTNVVLSCGGPLAVSVFLIVLSATGYGDTVVPQGAKDMKKLDITWRVCFGFGVLLPLVVFYFRYKMINSKLYRKNAIRRSPPYWLALKKYWPRLFGAAMSWFLYDFVAFSNGQFSGSIISLILKDPPLRKTAEYQLLLGTIALPGAFVGPWLIRKLGSKWLLVTGFTGYIIVGVIVGAAWDKLQTVPGAFVFMYGLLASFGNLGPGSACGLVASASFPTALRGTFYGFNAAFAKAGAAVGTQAFQPIGNRWGKNATFYWAAGIGAVGVIISIFFVPNVTEIDLAEQDREWNEYLLANGYDANLGDGSSGERHLADFASQYHQHAVSDSEETTRQEGEVQKI